jgi:hypothetical protein
MYPLNMKLEAGIGYAVANDEAEHKALTEAGYGPKYAAPEPEPEADPSETDAEGHTVESVRAALDAAGIAYDKRLGLAKLIALLPA